MIDFVKRYMPKLYEGNNEMEGLYDAEKDLYGDADESRQKLYGNLYIATADLDAIRKYEKTYNILADSSLTLEQRREKIVNELIFRPPFTRQRLKEILDMYYGAGNYAYAIYPDIFTVIIDVKILDPTVYANFNKLMRKIIPANMTLIFAIPYMYLYLERVYTYQSLAQHTYGELSQFADTVNSSGIVLK